MEQVDTYFAVYLQTSFTIYVKMSNQVVLSIYEICLWKVRGIKSRKTKRL